MLAAGLTVLLCLQGCNSSTDTQSVNDNSAPIADAGSDQNIITGTTVILDGAASSDPDMDSLTYRWRLSAIPENSIAELNDSGAVTPTFTADQNGVYQLELRVNDGTVDSAVSTVTITVNDPDTDDDLFNEEPLNVSSLPALQIGVNGPGSETWATANMLNACEAWLLQGGGLGLYTAVDAAAIADTIQFDDNGYPLSLPENSYLQYSVGYVTGKALNADEEYKNTYITGIYVLTWQGTGEVQFLTSSNNGEGYETLLNTPNRIVFKMSNHLKSPVVRVLSMANGDHVRNMRLWAPVSDGSGLELTSDSNLEPGNISASLEPAAGQPEPFWHPAYLKHQSENKAGVVRFMDWLKINGSNNTEDTSWNDKANSNYIFSKFAVIDGDYHRHPIAAYKQKIGLPFEWMINLSNTINKDMWIQVPHTSSDDFAQGLARLIAADVENGGLKKDLRVWIEFSNEIWNPVAAYLPQVNKAKQVAAEHFNIDVNEIDSFSNEHAWGAGYLQGNFLKAFENEWRTLGQSDARLINVVSGFTGNSTYNQNVLNSVKEIGANLSEVLAITNYFGHSVQGELFNLHNFGDDPGVWPAELYEKSKKIVRRDIYSTYNSWEANSELAAQEGIPLVAYEGGQHMLALGYGSWDNPSHADFMKYLENFQHSEEMNDLYREHFALWSASGASTVSQFVDISTYSFFGYWGAKENVTDTKEASGKWNAFINWAEIQNGVRAKTEPLGSRPELAVVTLNAEQEQYSQGVINAEGGDGNVTITLLGGDLPPGLTLESVSSGYAQISGIPQESGIFKFVIRARDEDGDVDDKIFTLNINPEGAGVNSLISFKGSEIPQTSGIDKPGFYNQTRSNIHIGDNSETILMPFSMEDGDAIFSDEYQGYGIIESTSPLTMYGGWMVTSSPFNDGTIPESYRPSTYNTLRNNSFSAWIGDTNAPTEFNLLLAWRSDQFSSFTDEDSFSFGGTASQSTLRIDITELSDDGENEMHFIILNHDESGDDVWYVSEASLTRQYIGDGYWELTQFSGSAEAGKGWATFAPTANDMSLPENLVFSSKTFNDVRAIGIVYRSTRGQYHYAFGFNSFLALGKKN